MKTIDDNRSLIKTRNIANSIFAKAGFMIDLREDIILPHLHYLVGKVGILSVLKHASRIRCIRHQEQERHDRKLHSSNPSLTVLQLSMATLGKS